MPVNLNAPPASGDIQSSLAVKVAQLAKQQMQTQGQIAVDLVNASAAPQQNDALETSGRVGTLVNTTA